MMYQAIFKHVTEKGYFDNHKQVLIAVSGGVDSMNLLHFLHQFKEKLSINIGIAHVNHKQRAESDEEEAYLRQWAEENDLPFYVTDFQGIFSEERAREFRYHFFRKIMVQKGYTALVTAHHADDNAETVLMRLARGSRLRHLSGISPVLRLPEGELIRPFLSFHKSELPVPFHFEDYSNRSCDFFRNRIRHHYLPLFQKENPQISQQLNLLSQEVSILFQALSDLTEGLTVEDRHHFLKQSPSVQFYLFQDYLAKFPDLQLSKAQFDQVLHVIRTKQNAEQYLKSDYWLVISPKNITISKIRPRTDGQDDRKVLDYGSQLHFNGFHFSFKIEGQNPIEIPLLSHSPICLRQRQSGDKINFGHHTKKLRRLFIDEKLSFEERRQAIVAEQDKEIIFVLAGDKTYLRKSDKNGTIKAKLYIQKETW